MPRLSLSSLATWPRSMDAGMVWHKSWPAEDVISIVNRNEKKMKLVDHFIADTYSAWIVDGADS